MAKSMGKKGTLCGPNIVQVFMEHPIHQDHEYPWGVCQSIW
jgi:hypothetical protein